MKITVLMVIIYILTCVRIGTKPCKYFQFNAPYFDRKRGIYSKLGIDQLIPEKWRLAQRYDDGAFIPDDWPVFVKPEWGQNAAGIQRADNIEQLTAIREEIAQEDIRYLVQEGAKETREFEIFSMRHYEDKSKYAVFSITEAVNAEVNPINSVYNENTRYVDITDRFDQTQRDTIWQQINTVGKFNISRASMRANSEEDLLAGRFHIIEINLFLPMPIHMLDSRYRPFDVIKMVYRYMVNMARFTKARDKSLEEKPVFTKIMMYNRKSKLINYLRAKI